MKWLNNPSPHPREIDSNRLSIFSQEQGYTKSIHEERFPSITKFLLIVITALENSINNIRSGYLNII
jgi:hypothetical protein